MEGLIRDLRFAVRSLRKDYRFSCLVILVLGLGVGTASVIFSVIYNGALNPFPYAEPNRLVRFYIHNVDRASDRGADALSWSEFLDFRQQNKVFEDMIAFSNVDVLYTHGEITDQLALVEVTSNAFQILGVKPYLGRLITTADGEKGSTPVMALNYSVWRAKFNSDPEVIGRSVTLNGQPRTIVSVMPPRFQLEAGDAWVPLSFNRDENGIVGSGDNNTAEPLYVTTVSRLRPGITLRSASEGLNLVAEHLAPGYPDDFPKRFTVVIRTIADAALKDFHTKFYMLISAIAMLLLIAGSTVATLLLTRTTLRSREIAVRTSLGAGRGRLIIQFVAEGLVLAVMSALSGCLLAYGGLKWLSIARPAHLWFPDEAIIALNPIIVLFALGTSTLITLLCGLAPAIHLLRPGLLANMARAGRGADAVPWLARLRACLVVVEITMSIVLLIAAGLLTRSFLALTTVDLGFTSRNLIVGVLAAPKGRYDTAIQKKVYFQELLRRVNGLPGVLSAAETTTLPPYPQFNSKIDVPGQLHAEPWQSELDLCSEGIFQTLGLRLMNGRLLTAADVDSARSVVVVNRKLARTFFVNMNPVGQTIKFNLLDELPETVHHTYFEIVGVVEDIKNHGPQDPVVPEAYIPYSVSGFGDRALIVRTNADPNSLLPSISGQIRSLDSSVALVKAKPLENYMQDLSYALPQFGAASLGIFAVIGLALVVVGVFSLMAYAVSLRSHEFAVRMAVGAQRRDILRLVVKNGVSLLATGIVTGLTVGLVLTHFISAEIWGVSPADPLTITMVILLVSASGLVACLIPARRATSVDPLAALRYE